MANPYKCIAVRLAPWVEDGTCLASEISVFDVDGSDITAHMLNASVVRQLGTRARWAELELDLPGFDGRFSTPVVIQD